MIIVFLIPLWLKLIKFLIEFRKISLKSAASLQRRHRNRFAIIDEINCKTFIDQKMFSNILLNKNLLKSLWVKYFWDTSFHLKWGCPRYYRLWGKGVVILVLGYIFSWVDGTTIFSYHYEFSSIFFDSWVLLILPNITRGYFVYTPTPLHPLVFLHHKNFEFKSFNLSEYLIEWIFFCRFLQFFFKFQISMKNTNETNFIWNSFRKSFWSLLSNCLWKPVLKNELNRCRSRQ